MSSVTLNLNATVVHGARSQQPSRLRLTERGRAVLLGLAAVPLAVGIAFAALSGGSATAASGAASDVSFDSVTVLPGDTLWSIAGALAPEADPRDVIGEISRLNMLRGGVIQIGQELAVPVEYAH